MRFALAVVTLSLTLAACGDSKPPMVPDNPDLSQQDGGAPAPTSTAPTPNPG